MAQPQQQQQAKISVVTTNTPREKVVDEFCEFTEQDSDADTRVAEKPRITRPVKTFEKGEIVVSMDGELLLVASVQQPQGDKTKDSTQTTVKSERRNSSSGSSTVDDENERSLGSIEEPDVLECWEAETVEPVATPKKMDLPDDDLSVTKDDGSDHMGHVQRYYRFQDDSSDTSLETYCDDVDLNEDLTAAGSRTVPKTPERMTAASICSEEEDEDMMVVVAVPEEKPRSIADAVDSSLPIDEAFEAYESFYNGKSWPFSSIDARFGKSRFFGRREDGGSSGAMPCRAVCCNIQ